MSAAATRLAVSRVPSRRSNATTGPKQDRELGLDRIASYHLPGQELATLIGLAIWNERVVRGFQLERPPDGAGPAAAPGRRR